MKRIYRRNK